MGFAAGIERMLLARAGARGELGAGAAPQAGRGGPGERPLELFIVRAGAGEDADGAKTQRRAAFALLGDARSAGLSAQMELAGRSVKGALGHADALGARFVAIVDGDRSALRDMQDGGQEELATDTVTHTVLARLRAL
jgi:histidyl-tRNA synthetase